MRLTFLRSSPRDRDINFRRARTNKVHEISATNSMIKMESYLCTKETILKRKNRGILINRFVTAWIFTQSYLHSKTQFSPDKSPTQYATLTVVSFTQSSTILTNNRPQIGMLSSINLKIWKTYQWFPPAGSKDCETQSCLRVTNPKAMRPPTSVNTESSEIKTSTTPFKSKT